MGESTFSVKSNKLDKVYLELAGVPGDINNGLIPLESFDLGAGGVLTGNTKVTISTFDVTKKIDDASNSALVHHYVTRTRIQSGKIIVMDKKGAVVTYDVSGVEVTGISEGSSGKQPTESVSFSFAKIMTVFGSGNSKVSTGWNSAKPVGGFNITQVNK